MAKKSGQKEAVTKPKFHQTRLCFSSTPITKVNDDTNSLEQSIQNLVINSKKKEFVHPDPCKDCNKSIPKVKCTALKENSNEPCTYSFCEDCIVKKTNEDLEWIKNNKTRYISKSGKTIEHRSGLTEPRWACLICRGLCECELCAKKFRVPRLSFNKRTIDAIPRPELSCVDLLYSEEEIWIRLQIREFIFRFGGLYDFDSRLLNSLQNVQGDWKIKRLGAYIVWKFLVILSTSGQFELSQSSLTEETVPQRARTILNDWMMEKKLFRLYLDTASRHQALLDILNVEGMTGKRWQDIAELLALADLHDLPVPTSRDIQNVNANVEKDKDDMEIDGDDVQELEKKIRRFQKSGRSLALLSSPDELRMLHMLLELLLFETVTRQSLNIPGTGSKTKEVKDRELELKKYSKEYLVEESKKKAQRSNLLTRISQLKVIKGKEEDLKTAQIDLDLLETAIRDDRMELEKKKLELDIYAAKARKRMEPIGYDKFDNEYWIFNDVLDHLSHASDFRNSEPYWAYGVIIIGPGFNSSVGEESNKWWYIKGKKNLSMLADWIKQNPKDKEENKQSVESFVNKIQQRIDHLTSLEWAVYGTGFFS